MGYPGALIWGESSLGRAGSCSPFQPSRRTLASYMGRGTCIKTPVQLVKQPFPHTLERGALILSLCAPSLCLSISGGCWPGGRVASRAGLAQAGLFGDQASASPHPGLCGNAAVPRGEMEAGSGRSETAWLSGSVPLRFLGLILVHTMARGHF